MNDLKNYELWIMNCLGSPSDQHKDKQAIKDLSQEKLILTLW